MSNSCLRAENGFVTVTPFHVKPSCKSSKEDGILLLRSQTE